MGRMVKVAVFAAALALVIGSGRQQVAWGAEDTIMGQYTGTFTPVKGSPVKAKAEVVAWFEMKGKHWKRLQKTYRAILSTTPEGDAQPAQIELRGQLPGKIASLFRSSKKLHLAGNVKGVAWTGTVAEGKLTAETGGVEKGRWQLRRIEPKSPTEGEKPPAGAIVLLPYEPGKPTNLDEWTNKNWKILADGTAQVFRGATRSLRQFGSCRLHVEFLIPYEPLGRGQGRGNSGVYLQDLYEIQVLDSFGLAAKNNECGALYSIVAPKVNACFPPLRWQTYDITFHAPKFAADGTVEKAPNVTIVQNGVTILDNVSIPRDTENRKQKPRKLGPIQIQDHSHPVRYRNIWVVELKD
jgi:hypothetical protein